MAPRNIELQTRAIIACLFDEGVRFRRQDSDYLETDGAGDDSDDEFDPVPIAEKLKQVADGLMTDPRFQDVKKELLSATTDHVVREVFSKNVEALCRAQPAEVAPEIQMTRTAIALGLFLKKNLPHLGNKVQNIVLSYVRQNVGEGGWDAVVANA